MSQQQHLAPIFTDAEAAAMHEFLVKFQHTSASVEGVMRANTVKSLAVAVPASEYDNAKRTNVVRPKHGGTLVQCPDRDNVYYGGQPATKTYELYNAYPAAVPETSLLDAYVTLHAQVEAFAKEHGIPVSRCTDMVKKYQALKSVASKDTSSADLIKCLYKLLFVHAHADSGGGGGSGGGSGGA